MPPSRVRTETERRRQEIATRVAQLREHLGMNGSDFAALMNWYKQTLLEVEKGNRSIRAEELEKLAYFLGTSVQYLVTGEVH